jgi:hypothetical protein
VLTSTCMEADCLSGLFRRHKRVLGISKAFCYLRRCYPRKRLFMVLDNLHNVHDHPRFLALLRRLHTIPVWTPTEASWLNPIEAQFGVLKRFTLANTDDPPHVARRRRIYAYLRYRHRKLANLRHPLNRIRSFSSIKLEWRQCQCGLNVFPVSSSVFRRERIRGHPSAQAA